MQETPGSPLPLENVPDTVNGEMRPTSTIPDVTDSATGKVILFIKDITTFLVIHFFDLVSCITQKLMPVFFSAGSRK